MIDWLTFTAPLSIGHRLPTDRVQHLDVEGEVVQNWPKPLRARGSHDKTVSFRQQADDTVTIAGCPAKFLQGHNVWGCDQLPLVTARMYLAVLRALDLDPVADDLRAVALGHDVTLSRVDVTYSTPLASRAAVLDVLRRMEGSATLARRGRGQLVKGSTLYFNQQSDAKKKSRRWKLKLYSKGNELADRDPAHRLPVAILEGDHGKALLEHADPLLRIELEMGSMELTRLGLRQASAWHDPTTPRRLHRRHLEKLNMPVQKLADDALLERLPNALRLVCAAHLAGEDTKRLCSKATWYRHRKALLAYGVDLATATPRKPLDDSKQGQPLPLLDITPNYVEQVPDWARGTALYVGGCGSEIDPPADFFEWCPELFVNPPIYERPDLFAHPDTGEPMTIDDVIELRDRDDREPARPRLRLVSSRSTPA